jgi:hypothetical protein
MKKITKPAEKEEATYYSDFSGKCFGEFHPHIELKLEFNYGSGYDGSRFTFHLDDKDIEDVLFLLKGKLSNETKKVLKQRYVSLEKDYDQHVQCRDWTNCDYICNEQSLLTKLI